MIWHHETSEAVIRELGTDDENGLTAEEAAARLAEDGHNRYYEKKTKPVFRQIGEQLKKPSMWILALSGLLLLISAVVALMNDQPANFLSAAVVLLLPFFGALVCVLMERRATSHLHRVSNTQNNTVTVLRDGEWISLSAADVVRGDVLRLLEGMIIPADARLIEAQDLRCDQCVLTGEETEVAKSADALLEVHVSLSERANMVYAGCGVSHGSGIAVVVATAQATEYALMLNDQSRENSPLPVIGRDIASLEKIIQLPITVIAAVLALLAVFRHTGSLLASFSGICAVIAAAIPTGLLAVATIAMATGLREINDRHADVRELSVMGALARVTVICANKTGMLTSDEKRPVCVFTGDQTELLSRIPSDRAQLLIRLAALCTESDTRMAGRDNDLIGNPTESAVIEYARDIGLERRQLMEDAPRLAVLPFDRVRRRTSVVHLVSGRKLMITMGAPDAIYDICDGECNGAKQAQRGMEEEALRVLAVAYKYVDDLAAEHFSASEEHAMTLAGLIALGDRPREDSAQAIAACSVGGITTVMTTGDSPVTAKAVGEQLGILWDDSEMITGEQLALLTDDQLEKEIHHYRVYAQIGQEDRLRVIRAWQKTGETVAVTGSGLSDVPALQAADVGCAAGAADCDMTRDASDVALHDNRFASLVDVIRQARGVYANIRKATQYAVTCGIACVFSALLGIIVHKTLPVSAPGMALFWMAELVLTLAIGFSSPDRHALVEKPRKGLSRLMPPGAWGAAVWQGLLTGICVFIAFDIGRMGAGKNGSELELFGVTTAFITLILSRLWLALLCGHNRHGVRMVPLMAVVVFIVSALCVVIPPVSGVMGLTQVLPSNWLIAVLLSLIPAVAAFIAKTFSGLTRSVKEP